MTKTKIRIIKILSLALVMAATLVSAASTWAKDIPIVASDYGYGEYVVKARGVGYNGVYDEDLVKFYYYPVNGELTEDENTGDYTVNLEYEEGDGTSAGEVGSVIINVLDPDGNTVGPSPIRVEAPGKTASFNLDEYGLASGIYTVEIIAYSRDGEMLYKPIKIGEIDYKAIPVPDTGGFFQGLNISKLDYMLTGLIIFSLIGIGGAIFIAKRNKNSRTIRRRRR